MLKKLFLGVSLFALLLGCSSGEGGPPTVEEKTLEAQRIIDRVERQGFPLPSNLPTSGSATFEGPILMYNDDFIAGGDLSLTASWSSNVVSGRATNFVDIDDRSLSGSLALTNGQLDRTPTPANEIVFTGDLTGQLRDGATTRDFDTATLGGFYGNTTPDAVLGIAAGNMTTTTGGRSSTTLVEGVFAAERQ